MMKFHNIVIVSFLLASACAALQIGTGSYTVRKQIGTYIDHIFAHFSSLQSDSGIFKWTMTPDDPLNTKTIFYEISAKTTGWAGIGFGETHQMLGRCHSYSHMPFFFLTNIRQ